MDLAGNVSSDRGANAPNVLYLVCQLSLQLVPAVRRKTSAGIAHRAKKLPTVLAITARLANRDVMFSSQVDVKESGSVPAVDRFSGLFCVSVRLCVCVSVRSSSTW